MTLRNFITTLRKQKTASLLNIIGLTIAFTAFYVIVSQIWYSVTYNRPLANSERTYLISPDGNHGDTGVPDWSENCPQPASLEAVSISPDAEAYTHFRNFASPAHVWRQNDGVYTRHNFGSYDVASSAVDVFGFKTVSGDLTRIGEPNTIIISRSASEAMGCGVGDAVWFDGGKHFNEPDSKVMMTVAGIFEDFPKNTFLHGHHIFRDDKCWDGDANNNWNYSGFVRLKEGADPEEFAKIWERQYDTWFTGMVEEWKALYGEEDEEDYGKKLDVKLIALDKIYFEPDTSLDQFEMGSMKTTLTLAVIGLIIIIVAFINFFNFYMALVPMRIRNVSINKVLGATQAQLIWRLVMEAVMLTGIAFILSVVMIQIVQDSFLTDYVTCSLDMGDNLGVIAVIGILMVLTAGISALYPAIYTTSANTSMSIKAGYAQSKAGRTLRSVLVGIQFTVSMILIIITAVFFMQYRYMIKYDMGFDKENVLTFSCNEIRHISEATTDRLGQHPDVTDVAASFNNVFSSMHNIWERGSNDKYINLHAYVVSRNFLEFMDIPIIEGEGFSNNTDGEYQMVLTKSTAPAVREIYPDGYFDEDMKIVGTIPDIRLTSVSAEDIQIGLYYHPRHSLNTFYIRTRPEADIEALKKSICDLVSELAPMADEPDIRFLDEYVEKIYGDTKKQTTTIGIFAFIAILISLIGVFSIVMFETQHRTSEIAVRKVYGATTDELVMMFNRRYLIIVAICFIIAVPVAWTIAGHWLEQFAHRIPVPLWAFPATLTIVLAITCAIVSLRSLRTARTNPAEALKKE